MNDLRERIAREVPSNCEGVDNGCQGNCVNCSYAIGDAAEALIPKPTVRVKCDKCGGTGESCPIIGKNKCEKPDSCHEPMFDAGNDEWLDSCEYICDCPSCTDGWNEHEIVWDIHCDLDNAPIPTILTLPDLIDPDVRNALHGLEYQIANSEAGGDFIYASNLSNNKGSLRIGEVEG